jgi:hypothetical protein
MTQFQTTLPAVLHQHSAHRPHSTPVRVFAQDESRVGLLPIVRRRITACGVQPIATITHRRLVFSNGEAKHGSDLCDPKNF